MDLDTAPDVLQELLCAEERARAARIVHARNRVLWARSRGILRALLGHYLDADPSELRFELGAHGKPALKGVTGQESDLRFNLSHSNELMLVAVTAGLEVGVDIECANDRHTAEDLCTWTMHEAMVKCLGTGLTSMSAENQAPPAGLRTVGLDVGPRAAAALAVELTPPRASAPRSTRGVHAGCPRDCA